MSQNLNDMQTKINLINSIFVLIMALFFSNEVCAQASSSKGNSYVINGHIPQVEKGKMILQYRVGEKTILDSARIEKGSFFFEGSLQYPAPARLYLKDSRHQYADQNISFYLENSPIQIIAFKDSMSASIVKGSHSNDDNKAIESNMASYFASLRSLRTIRDFAVKQHLDSVLRDIDRIYEEFPAVQRKLIVDYALTHPHSFAITTMLFINFTNNQTQLPLLKRIYDHFSDSVKASVGGQGIAGLIKRMQRVEVGKTAPDFTLPDTSGIPVKLSSFSGKYVLIDFWASWCVPCRAESPFLVKAYRKYHNKNFTIVSVSLDVDMDKQKWLDAIRKDGMVWHNVSSLKGYDEEGVRQLYSVQGIPDNFLINPEGEIIARGLRGNDLSKKLSEVFDE